jgi:hypothetical protein
LRAVPQYLSTAFLRVFLDLNNPVIFLEQIMEKIGDREAAIADRVRALLEAANSTAAAVAGTIVPSAGVVRSASAPVTRSSRRLDPSLDPATVVANLTAEGIQLVVSQSIFHLICESGLGNFFIRFLTV